MDKFESEEWRSSHDMPHEYIMDVLGLKWGQLSPDIQRKIKEYNILYNEALKDGFVDDDEEIALVRASLRIARAIKEQHAPED